MATRRYTITIETPENEETDYGVTIVRHGELIAGYSAPLIPAMARLGREIAENMEEKN